MRIAQDNPRTHVYQLVNEEEPAFKHLLVDEHAASCLNGYDEQDTDKIRCQSGPWVVVNGKYRPVHVILYLIDLLLWNNYIIILVMKLYAQLPELVGDDTEMLYACILNS